ncbi:unnamed protein product [Spirodela intermedia]|uniref:Uncharacterized protein n=1 Tax=Spirodela intermedia TaxID=51605 RepID=A0A7I8KZL6_SPIIN|nr:unnamed protein product [Spirodela intermedia]
MAAAQARAAWQRIANRVFVQDDAKRAPKFASFSPSSLMLLPDSGITGLPKGSYRPASNRNIMSSSLPPETGSCFHPRRNFDSQKVLVCENMNAFEKETVTSGSLVSRDLDSNAAFHADGKSSGSIEAAWKVSTGLRNHQGEESIDDLDAMNSDACKNAADWLFLQKSEKNSFGSETPLGSEKIEPWWRIAETGELTLLVMQKSSERVENCDLPRPQTMLFCGDPLGPLEIFSFDRSCARDPLNDASISSTSGSHLGRSYQTLNEAGHPPPDDPPEAYPGCGGDSSRTALLGALRCSQTRAREAEATARLARHEKEHIVKLIFKQASHAFAYRLWIRMLEWERFFLHQRIKKQQPPVGGLVQSEVLKQETGRTSQKSGRGRSKAAARAVGLGLVGVGLLIGWSLGWLLSAF